MKHLFNTLSKLTAVAAVGLSISSCNRAEYAMLPKTTPYHATYGSVVKSEPASANAATVSPEEVAFEAPSTPQTEKVVAVEATTATTAFTSTRPVTAPATRPARVARTATPEAAPRKLNVAQRAMLAKVNKKVDKLVSKAPVMKRTEAASHEEANALSHYIKLGLILLLVGLVVGLVFGFLGYLISLVGVVLIILGLLDEI